MMKEVRHDGANTLTVELRNGRTYSYDAPVKEYFELKNAASAGAYYNTYIKGKYSLK